MFIKTDEDNNIIELIAVGGIPEEYGFEVSDISAEIIEDIFSYKYIDGEFIKNEERDILQENIETIRSIKISRMSVICHDIIEKGIDLNGSHYSLTSNDQVEMIKLESMIKMNPGVPVFYHADGEKCRSYEADEFLAISTKALGWITYNRTYFNLLKSEISNMTDVHEIIKINYGNPLNQFNDEILDEVMNGEKDLYELPIIDDDFDYSSMFIKHDFFKIPLKPLVNSDLSIIDEAEEYNEEN